MEHTHAHAHGHSHEHTHDGDVVEQICTIAVCGALGAVAIGLWYRDLLKWILHPAFHPLVLAAGVMLLGLVALRAVGLWVAVGREDRRHDHDHDHAHDHHGHDHAACGHDHGPDCGHDHAHDHGHPHHHHDHAHEHAWGPWRYVVLMLPVFLFLMGIPHEGFSRVAGAQVDIQSLSGGGGEVADKGFAPQLGFKELEVATNDPSLREYYTGRVVELRGQLSRLANVDDFFTLVRLKINCCAADAIPLKAIIFVDSKDQKVDTAALSMKWIKVKGQVQFRSQRNDQGQELWMPFIVVKPSAEEPLEKLVEPIPAEPYLY
jgi:hypothetical protein